MKQYLLDFLTYNDWANRVTLQSILQLNQKEPAVNLFSHLIHSQDKWFNRISKLKNDFEYQWYGPSISENLLHVEWERSIGQWLSYLAMSDIEILESDIYFIRMTDGKKMKVRTDKVIFHLNCHSIHHRAQINKMISSQGFEVPQTDFIFTALKEA